MSEEDREALQALIDEFPPTTFDNLVVVQTRIGVMVAQARIHPALADAALRWFEQSFATMMVAKDKMPKPGNKIEVNLLGKLQQAQTRVAGHLPAYTEQNDVWDAAEAPLERIRVEREG